MEIIILKFLIEHNSQKFSISQISQSLQLDYKNTYQAIQKLDKEKIIQLEKIGNTNQVQYNKTFNHKIFKVEEFRREELFKNKDFKLIFNKIKDLHNPFIIVLAFGSFIKKTNTKLSDIDLCLICNEEKTIKKLNERLSILPMNIHLNEFSTEEFKSMITTNKSNVGTEIVKHNVILYGIENYYKIIKNE